MLHPVIKTAPLQGVVHLPRSVRREDDQRRVTGANAPQLWNCHREVGKGLEQKGLELVVRTVDFIDQQHRTRAPERLQDRAGHQESFAVQLVLDSLEIELRADRGADLRCPQMQHLPRKIPVVQGLSCIDAFVALQPDQGRAAGLGQCGGERGLSDAGLPLQQQRAAQRVGEKGCRGDSVVRQVARALQCGRDALRIRERRSAGLGKRRHRTTMNHRRFRHRRACRLLWRHDHHGPGHPDVRVPGQLGRCPARGAAWIIALPGGQPRAARHRPPGFVDRQVQSAVYLLHAGARGWTGFLATNC